MKEDGDTLTKRVLAPLRAHAEHLGTRPAVTDVRGTLSYRALFDAITQLAERLETVGIGRGTPVLLQPDVSAESVVAYWALRAAGAVVVVGNPGSTAPEREFFLTKTGARHVFAGERAEAALPPPDGCAWHTLWADGAGHRSWQLAPARSEGAKATADHTHAHRAVVLFSSGTTGTPKAIVHSPESIAGLHATLLQTWKLSPDDTVLGALPFHTIYGLLFSAGTAVVAGSHLALLSRFRPGDALSAIAQHRVTTAAMVPAMLLMMMECEGGGAFDLSSLRAVYTASAPISPSDMERFAVFSGARVVANYGMTEIPGAVVEPADEPHRKGSVGRVSPGFEVVARARDGTARPRGETGEITMRGPSKMVEYLDDPERTAQRIRDGWVYSEDLGHVDSDGYVFLSGRMSDMIVRGGLNISPLEIEGVLAAHKDVADVAVIGLPDRVLGDVVAAAIVPRGGVDASALIESLKIHCANALAKEKVPVAFAIHTELPRNDGGKVLRKVLAQNWSQEQTG